MDPLIDIFRSFAQPQPGQEKPSEWSLIQVLQDAEKSNSIVVVCHCNKRHCPLLIELKL